MKRIGTQAAGETRWYRESLAFRPCMDGGLFVFLGTGGMDNQTNEFYDAIARDYPYFYQDWERQLEREKLSLRALFRDEKVRRVLDAGCGGGTQTIPLAQLNLEVVAADASTAMLAKARQAAERFGVLDRIHFKSVDFLNLREVIQGPFDAIVSKGNSLAHLLQDEHIESTVASFHELLREGGLLIVGMRDFDWLLEHRPRFLPGVAHTDPDGEEFITFDLWEWNEGPPIIASQNLYIVRGRAPQYTTIRRTVNFRPLSQDELQVVLLEAGFHLERTLTERGEQVLVARKPTNGEHK
jgi:glycine/sarcosine N-methyltransferase